MTVPKLLVAVPTTNTGNAFHLDITISNKQGDTVSVCSRDQYSFHSDLRQTLHIWLLLVLQLD